MKLGCVLFLAVLVFASGADAKRKHKKFEGRHHKEKMMAEHDEMDMMIEMMERDEAAERKMKQAHEKEHSDEEDETENPCNRKHCAPGKICRLDELGQPECICIPSCHDEIDPRRKVCSNYNETWSSDCTLHQMRCWCQQKDEKCVDEKLFHMHVEYYGECRDVEDCTDDQMADFPRRMSDWLFNVMRDLADREELSPFYLDMEREAEANLTRRWRNAAIWKWCDLEKNHDRAVSRHELFPIRAHIMAMEHCIAPFLDSCDIDNNHKITLKEWAKCLEINEDDIEERCEEIREENRDDKDDN